MTRPPIDHNFKPGRNPFYSQFDSAYCVVLVGEKNETGDSRTTCHRLESEHTNPEPLNRLDFDNQAEFELQQELRRLGIKNAPRPTRCPDCGVQLSMGEGMVGETSLYCDKHGVVWEDSEGAIRNVY